MANNKKFIVKNGLLTQENVVIGSSTDTGQKLQVTGDSKFANGSITVTNNDASTPTVTFTNQAGFSPNNSVIAKFVGDTDSLVITNIGAGDYAILNDQQSNGIKIFDGAVGVEVSYNNSTDLSFSSGGIDFKRGPTVNGSTIWHAGNDGSGSGLDADLLDGIDSANFVRSDQDDTMSGSYIITGNLTVQGITTTVNSENVLIADNILTLNSNYTGSSPSENAGVEVERGTLANAKLVWNETNDYWQLEAGGSVIGRIITTADEGSGNGFDADTVDGLEAAQFLRTDVDDTANGNITILGSLTLNDNVGGAYLYMDGSGTNRILYSNAGEIGFLNSSLNYAAKSDTNDNWVVTANTVAKSFVDSDNTAYYGNFAGTSVINNIALEGSISHNNNSNTYITFDATDTFNVYTGLTERLEINNSYAQFTNDVRAPRFVDSGDTTYLVDPAGTSRVNDISLVDQIIHDGDTDTYINFPAANQFQIVTGGATRLQANDTYVLANNEMRSPKFVDHNNNAYYGDFASTSVMNRIDIDDYIRHNGDTDNYFGFAANDTFRVFTGGTQRLNIDNDSADFSVNVYAPRYYDSNNTAYYADPASDSQMNTIDIDDYVRHRGDTNTYIGFPSNDNVVIVTNGTTRLTANNTHLTSTLNAYAPNMFASRFYDSDNTNYYTDPHTTSQMSTIDIDDFIRHRGDTTTYFGFNQALTYVVNTNGTNALTIDQNQVATFTSRVQIDTNPAATFGITEALRIDDNAGNNDRQLQFYELQNAGSRYHRISFNTDTTGGSGYTYTQGNWGGSSTLEFANDGSIKIYSNAQVAGGTQSTITPTEVANFDYDSVNFTKNTYAPRYYTDDYLYHNGDNSYLGFSANDTVVIATDNTVRFTVNTSSVTSTLNVYAPRYYTNDYLVHNGDTNTYVGFDANDQFAIWTAGTKRVNVSSGGQTDIYYRGTIGNSLTRPDSLADLSNSAARIGGSDVHLHIASLSNVGNYAVALQAGRESDDASFPIALQPNGGYTGIGTLTPSYTLDVYHATLDTIARFISGDNRAAIRVQDHDTSAYVLAENSLAHFGMTAYIDESNLVINATGNVGIGTVTPTEANLNISTRAAATANPFAAANKLISLQNNDTETFYWSLDNSNNNWLIGDGKTLFSSTGASLTLAVLPSAGDVVIGGNDAATYTVADTASVIDGSTPGTPRTISNNKLHVSGSVQLNNATDAYVIGNANATFLSTDELAFGSGGGWYMIDANYIRARNNKRIYTTGYVYGARFYDANDTNYYVDPNGDSQMNTIDIDDYIRHRGEVANTYIGFSASDTFKIYTGGTEQVNIDNNDATFTQNVYAPKYFDKNNNSYYADFANTTASLVFAGQSRGPNGALATPTYSFSGDTNTGMFRHAADRIGFSAGGNDEFRVYTSYTLSPGSSRAPIFYDSNDTNYYGNFAGESRLSTARFYGGAAAWGTAGGGTQGTTVGTIHLTPSAGDHNGSAITFGAEDSSSGTTAQAGIYTRTDGSYGSRMYFSTTDSYATGSKTALYINQAGQIIATRAGMYAPVFYDSNDSNYYGDFASTSIMNVVRVNQLQIDNANNYIDGRAGDYGTIRVEDLDTGWAGYAIRDDWVFMSNGSANAGIYNDTRNEWAMQATDNSWTRLYANGAHQISAENGYGYAPSSMRSPIFYDSNNTNYYANFAAGNTGTAVKVNGQIYRDGFDTSGNGDVNKYLVAQDYSHWIWNTATNWGIFWAGDNNAAYTRFSTTNPNELVFVGAGNVRASLDLDNGNFYAQGTGTFANLAINGGNEDLPLLKVYGTGMADPMLFDGTLYWEKRVIQAMQGTEDYATPTTSEYSKVSDGPFTSSYALRTNQYRTFISDYIEVEPGEEVYGEISQRYISGSGGVLYYGLERFDKDKKPIATNNGTIYFVASNVNYTGTAWETRRGHTTIPTSHTAYNGSDGGGCRYVRIRLLMNYSGGGALREFGPPILKRSNTQSNIRSINSYAENYMYAQRFYDSDNTGFYLDPASTSYLNDVRADILYDRNNTSYYINPASTSNVVRLDGDELNIDGGTRNNANDGTVYITATNNNDWGLIVNKNNTNATEYGIDLRMGSSHTYGMRLRAGSSERWRLNNSYGQHWGSLRAPIFYDQNDTNYYTNPASTSVMNKLHVGGITTNYADGNDPDISVGDIFATDKLVTPRLVFYNDASGDDNYITHTDTNSAYTAAGNSMGAWFEFVGDKLTADGSNSAGIVASGLRSTYVEAKSNVRTPIMYDSNNTGYYSNPASTSRLSSMLINAIYMDSYAYRLDSTSNTYGTMGVYGYKNGYNGLSQDYYWVWMSNGSQYSGLYNDQYNEWAWLAQRNAEVALFYNGSWEARTQSSYFQARLSFRAPIFYDSDNTFYYADPNAYSRFNDLDLYGTLYVNGDAVDFAPTIWYSYQANVTGYAQTPLWTRVGRVDNDYTHSILEYVYVGDWDGAGMAHGKVELTRDNGGTITIHHLQTERNAYENITNNSSYEPHVIMDTDNNIWIAVERTNDVNTRLWFRWVKKDGINDNYYFGSHYQNVAVTYNGGATIVKTGKIKPGIVWTVAVGNAASYSGGPFASGGASYLVVNRVYATEGLYDKNNNSRYVRPNSTSYMNAINHYGYSYYRDGSEVRFYSSAGTARGYIQATETNDEHLIIATSSGEDIAFKDNGVGGTTNMIIRGDGDVIVTRNLYADQFIDADDNGYYINPNGNSNISTMDFDRIDGPSNSTRDKIRVYDSSNYAIGMQSGISFGGLNDWAMTFQFNDDNDRGFWWGDSGHTTAQGAMSLTTQGYLTVAERIKVGYGQSHESGPGYSLDISGTGYSANDFRAPVFYDSNDTNYYVNPNGTSVMSVLDVRSEIYNDGWFRNDTDGKGLYSTAHAMHFYSTDDNYWDITHDDDNAHIGLRLRGTYDGTIRGYLYAESDNDFGLLNNGGSWRLRIVGGDWIDAAGSSVRAKIFYDRDNTGYYLNPASTSRTNYHQIYNLYDANTRRFTSPNGGMYTTTTSSVTGAIRIRMPTNRFKSNTMMSFTVNIFDYEGGARGQHLQYRISGYNNNNTSQQWYACSSTQIGDEIASWLRVRWGGNGTDNCVWIGETNTTWSYPQVWITDVQIGYSGLSANWGQDWYIDFVTSFDTVTVSQFPNVLYGLNNKDSWVYSHYGTIYYDTNNTGYYLNPASTSNLNAMYVNRIRVDDGGTNGHIYTDDAYLDLKYGGNGDGGIELYNGDGVRMGTWFSDGDGTHGFFDNNDIWAVKIQTGTDPLTLSCDGNNEFFVYTTYTYSPGSSRSPIFYDSNDTNYYLNPNGTSNLNDVYINTLRLDDGGSGGHIYTGDTYLDVSYGATGGGGIRLYDNEDVLQGYWYGNGAGEHGFLDNDGSWAVRVRTGTNAMIHYCNGNAEFYVYTSYTYSPGSSRAPIFYDSNDTFYYTNPAGTSRMNGINAYGEIRSDENIIAYYDYSDIRWKENVKVIENAVEKVQQLDGITYNYTDREGEYTGVIAQQVEKVLPGVVYDTTDMKTGKERKAVRYGNMVGLLIEATKEQQETINNQQKEIDNLKEMVKILMDKLDK